jgi:hypothetical protein
MAAVVVVVVRVAIPLARLVAAAVVELGQPVS